MVLHCGYCAKHLLIGVSQSLRLQVCGKSGQHKFACSVIQRQIWFTHPHALKSGQSSQRSQSTQGPQRLYGSKVRITQGICHQAYQGNLHRETHIFFDNRVDEPNSVNFREVAMRYFNTGYKVV